MRPLDEPGPSGMAASGGKRTTDEDEDAIELLDEAAALELVEFDPIIKPKEAPASISTFLSEKKSAVMKDFTKLSCKVLSAPKLDDQVKDQLNKKEKDPHFGSASSSFRSSSWTWPDH